MLRAMDTHYFWRCTDAITGRRYTTRWRMTEAEARARLIEPERIEYGALTVEPSTAGHSMSSGLVRRADGAMMPPP
jgi:hypothetical protein